MSRSNDKAFRLTPRLSQRRHSTLQCNARPRFLGCLLIVVTHDGSRPPTSAARRSGSARWSPHAIRPSLRPLCLLWPQSAAADRRGRARHCRRADAADRGNAAHPAGHLMITTLLRCIFAPSPGCFCTFDDLPRPLRLGTRPPALDYNCRCSSCTFRISDDKTTHTLVRLLSRGI